MRGIEALQKIKDEITKDDSLKGLTPSEIAIKLSEPRSKEPPEFVNVPVDVVSVIAEKASVGKQQDLKDAAIEAEIVESKDFDDKQVEVLTRICDELELGEIVQGDVEQALLLK